MEGIPPPIWPQLSLPPGLYLVPTPIGNLADISLRALGTLAAADVIACEDTRHSLKLLQAYGINRPLLSLHQHNEHQRVLSLVHRVLQEEKRIAIITDAGTPGISDPGFLAVREGLVAGIHVEVLPGATAFVPALVLSGLPADRFVFEGFLPAKKGRQKRLQELATEPRTILLYESPHRVLRLVKELIEHVGEDRPAAVVREISKLHEACIRAPLAQLLVLLQEHETAGSLRGEFVVVVGGADA